ncbi:MAG: AAA family ATPase [Clostridia bacterium]|nr:AAA family ATPase [Clostridia bacterium]
MKKIMVIGCPGSGKSTFSRELHKITSIPLFHLDMMNWNADRTTVEKSVFRERLINTIKKSEWIIDGNYGSTIELRLNECDTVIFLDYPLDVCLNGIKERRGKERADMPWKEDENEEDAEFIEFIKNYNTQSRPKVMELFEKYSDRNIFIFTSRNEADEFLKSLDYKNI